MYKIDSLDMLIGDEVWQMLFFFNVKHKYHIKMYNVQ